VPQMKRKPVFELIARFVQAYGTERLLVDTALEDIEHLATLRTLYAHANNGQNTSTSIAAA
jgi:hypothetical protein